MREVEVDREAVRAYTHGESAGDSHSCGKEELQEVQFDRQPQMPTRISRWAAQAQQDVAGVALEVVGFMGGR